MNYAVRQHWMPFKSPRASVVVSGNSTWYDVPAPVIVHGRSFEEEEHDLPDKMDRLESETEGFPVLEPPVHYENNPEPKLNGLERRLDERESEDCCALRRDGSRGQRNSGKPRHSSSIELTAATRVQTDADGVPTITFSFFRTERAGAERPQAEHLYDFPRNSRVEAGPAENLYDAVQAETRSETSASTRKTTGSEEGFETSRTRRGGSSKSLKWRRSLGRLEGLARPAHSDSEAPESRANWPRKPRLGTAWHRMRSWLSEERAKLGQVVARHARLQAVGARMDGLAEEPGDCATSYDLDRARLRPRDLTSPGGLTRVEELGPSRAAEELAARESGQLRRLLMKKTASSDDILAEESVREKPAATSFSLERLCSDGEEEEEEEEEEEVVVVVGEEEAVDGPRRKERRRFPRGRLIKRRMLGSIRGLIASSHLLHEPEECGPGGFEEVRRYVKQGGDFCKELAAILHERAELEANYAKGLSKLSGKLTKACAKDQGGNGSGGVSEAWRSVGEEMEAAAEAHRAWGNALGEQLAKPLRVGVAEVQGRTRKSIENSVDKASKSLQEWRTVAAKTKKQSFACARENERLQDIARLQSLSQTHQHHQQHHHPSNNKLVVVGGGGGGGGGGGSGGGGGVTGSHMTEKEATKLETRRRKAEDSARRADTEFYTVTVRAERARLEYECTVRKAAKQMELLEEERLSALKDLANVYLAHLQALAPKLQQSADRLSQPIRSCSVAQDIEILKNLIRRIDGNDSPSTEQLLPDFYAEHVTLAMNRERRKQALVRVLHLIRQDLERERRAREGLETLHRAFIKTPAFAADESTQNVTDKLLHIRSMLTYLEAARYKVGGALSELEGGKRGKHPLAEHILVSRDKQGLQQSVLKVPSWVKNESFELHDTSDGDLEVLHLSKDSENEQRDWTDRTAGDGNSENPPDEEDFSDFDEFSSNSEDNSNHEVDSADVSVAGKSENGLERCRAIYQYSANLNDELSLNPGDLITVHEKQADGWWIGECRGRTGIFPATYVQVIN